MRLKGEMTIELTDTATGEVETVVEENMITNAVNHILGLNPMGIFYNVGNPLGPLDWDVGMLPICPNMIGGILLFSKPLEESADNIYVKTDNLPVAYASNNVNSSANVARGSMNQTESKALENGYRFVWEFTPSQGNGSIAAVALTSARGGLNGFGSLVDDTTVFQQVKSISIGDIEMNRQMVLFEAVEMDFEHDLLYSITFENSAVKIRKLRVPVFSIGLNEKLNDSSFQLLEEKAVTTSTFSFLGDYTKYGEFMDGQDGYWYGFSNVGNSSGNATMVWVKISKTDYSIQEGQWTLANAKLMNVGERELNSYPERNIRCCLRKGYLYVMAYNKKGIYKINISNPTDVTLIDLGFTSKWKPLCDPGSCEVYMVLIGGSDHCRGFPDTGR